MKLPHIFFAVVLAAAAAAPGQAQTASPVPRNDAALSLGWLGSQYPGLERYDRWHQSAAADATFGHYWNAHLKTEMAATWIGRVHFDSYESVALPEGSAYVRNAYRFQAAKLSFGQVYQFRENVWVHPYLGAGVDVNYLRSTEERPAQVVSAYNPSGPGSPTSSSRQVSLSPTSERATTVQARPFVKGGFKFYVSDGASFITEWKFGLSDQLQDVMWKTGFGIDF